MLLIVSEFLGEVLQSLNIMTLNLLHSCCPPQQLNTCTSVRQMYETEMSGKHLDTESHTETYRHLLM